MFEEPYMFERPFRYVVTKCHWKGSLFAAYSLVTDAFTQKLLFRMKTMMVGFSVQS